MDMMQKLWNKNSVDKKMIYSQKKNNWNSVLLKKEMKNNFPFILQLPLFKFNSKKKQKNERKIIAIMCSNNNLEIKEIAP